MIPLQFIGKLIKILRSAASPSQIAGGFLLGMMVGLIPLKSLFSLLIIILIIILNVNISAAIFAFAIFSGVAYLIDPLAHSLGFWVLVELDGLRPFWTTLYNIPIVPFTRFYNTVVMGNLLISLILAVPVFFLVKRFIITYRESWEPRVQKFKIVQLVKGSKIFQLYEQIKNLGE